MVPDLSKKSIDNRNLSFSLTWEAVRMLVQTELVPTAASGDCLILILRKAFARWKTATTVDWENGLQSRLQEEPRIAVRDAISFARPSCLKRVK